MEDQEDQEEWESCITCGDAIEDVVSRSRSGNAICDDCRSSDWTWCEWCDNYVLDRYFNPGADACGRCVDDRFVACVDCGGYVHTDQSYYSEYDNQDRCEDCHMDHNDGRLNGVRGYHEGAPWGLTFHHVEERLAQPGEHVYFGVELECEDVSDIEHVLMDMEDLQIGHAEQDSSLNNGLEFITQPATLGAWRGEFGQTIREYMRRVIINNGDFDRSTCGAHVHVSRTTFTSDSHLARFVMFVRINGSFIETLSGRENMDRWSKVNDYYTPDTMAREIKSKRGDRYRAVNLNNENTVEVRAFKGTNNYADIIGSIEFIAALAEYTKDLTIPDVHAGALLADSFTTWLSDPELANYPAASTLIESRLVAA